MEKILSYTLAHYRTFQFLRVKLFYTKYKYQVDLKSKYELIIDRFGKDYLLILILFGLER